jgi:hypothetical protein
MPLTKIQSLGITDGTIVNADINASAAIDGTKLSGAGKVLQVVNMTTTTGTTTTSTSFVVTALTLSITPSSASNKILILATGNVNNTSASKWCYATLARGGTNLGASEGMTGVYSNGGDIHAPCTMVYLDSPSSTSSLTYDVRIKADSGTAIWNQQVAKASLTLMEIAG